jgi:hypothetical protein
MPHRPPRAEAEGGAHLHGAIERLVKGEDAARAEEREAVAKWLLQWARNLSDDVRDEAAWVALREAAKAIRSGAHRGGK